MDKHTFLKLPLIFTIDRDIGELLKKIEEEEKRITQLDRQRQERQLHLEHSESALKQTNELIAKEEKELHSMDINYKKAEANQKSATNQPQLDAASKTIESLGPKIEETEMLILDLLEKKDQLSAKIAEDQKFLAGSHETKKVITLEVEQSCQQYQVKIKELEENIQTLLNEIPKLDRDLVIMTRTKFRFKQPLAKVMGNNCAACGAAIDRMTQSTLSKQISIELCPGCGRMLMLGES